MGIEEDRQPNPLCLSVLTGCWLLLLAAVQQSGVAAQDAPALQLPPAEAESSVGFTRISSVRELRDGRLLLTDDGENLVRVLDWSSNSVEDIGREGDGPGEYRGVGWLYPLSASATLLTDRRSHRWYVLDGADIERTLASTRPVPSLVNTTRFFGTADGRRVLTQEGYRWDPSVTRRRPQSADSLVALLVEADVELERVLSVDTVAVLQGRGLAGDDCSSRLGVGGGGGGGGGVRTCSRVASEDIPLLFEDGWLAVARVRPYRVDWRTPEGEWVLGAPLEDEDGPPMDRRQKCWVMQGYPPAGPEDCDDGTIDSWGWPDAMPAFLPRVTRSLPGADVPVLLPTSGGSLLIRRAPRFPQARARYDLVDRTGTLTATLVLPPREAIVGFGEDVVYTVRMDDVELQWLRRHPWPMGSP